MPLHDLRCPNGHTFEEFVRLDALPKCPCGASVEIVHLQPAMVHGDYPGYRSPVTGEWIEGRRQRREDLARHNCVPYEEGMKQDHSRRQKGWEESLDHRVGETVEAQIHQMPSRKREVLEAELRAGASAEYVRLSK